MNHEVMLAIVTKKLMCVLTCYFQGGVTTHGFSEVVAGHTDIRSFVWFAPAAVNYSQKEEGAGGQQHAMGSRVIFVCLNPLAIFVPLHRRHGSPLSLAVEGSGFALGNYQVGRMLHDAGWRIFLSQTRSCRTQTRDKSELMSQEKKSYFLNKTIHRSCLICSYVTFVLKELYQN